MLFDITYMWNLKKAEVTETDSRIVLARSRVLGNWADLGQKVQTSSDKMNDFWGSNVLHGDSG